jgi:hypothetical protein
VRKLLIVLTLTTAMVALAGACDPSEGGGSSAKTSFEITTTGPPVDPEVLGQPDPVTMTGQGAGEVHGASSSMTVEMLGMGGFEMRQIEDTVYIKMPEDLVAQMPGARPWMEADLEAMYGRQYGARPAQMRGGAGAGPHALAGVPARRLRLRREGRGGGGAWRPDDALRGRRGS